MLSTDRNASGHSTAHSSALPSKAQRSLVTACEVGSHALSSPPAAARTDSRIRVVGVYEPWIVNDGKPKNEGLYAML